jgi:hypothetical protein
MENFLHSWNIQLFPLKVIYSPTLRLRYTVAWECEARTLNKATGVLVFQEPEMASEPILIIPGLVYVEDARGNGLDPGVFIDKESSKAVSAIVRLPLNEKDSESTVRVVKEAISLLFHPNL